MSELVKLYENFKGGQDVKKVFEENYIRILDKEHPNISLNDKINFLYTASLAGADPRVGDVFLLPIGGKGTAVFSYHFLMAKGLESGSIDSFEVNTGLEEVFDPVSRKQRKEVVSTAKVYRKGIERPIVYKARWSEFKKNNVNWNTKPNLMLEKCAIANAFRWACPKLLGGMYMKEEMEDNDGKDARFVDSSARDKKVNERDQVENREKEAIIKFITQRLAEISKESGIDDDEGKKVLIQDLFGIKSFYDLYNMSIVDLRKAKNRVVNKAKASEGKKEEVKTTPPPAPAPAPAPEEPKKEKPKRTSDKVINDISNDLSAYMSMRNFDEVSRKSTMKTYLGTENFVDIYKYDDKKLIVIRDIVRELRTSWANKLGDSTDDKKNET